jgi:SpoVK/Ycf46/Vps4 family AAA+-type ATPase
VLVLDDADDLLVGREWATGSTASADRAIVNTTLQELAGFGGRLAGVLVILTTNRFSSIDEAVRSRIPLHIPVPYPLNREQVREVTQTIAREYGFFLSQDMQARLIERFMQPVIRSTSARASEDEEERAQIRTNLFSPREIRQAMLLLEGNLLDSSVNSAGEDAPSSRYAVTNADVQRMEDYYEQLSRSPEMQEILG